MYCTTCSTTGQNEQECKCCGFLSYLSFFVLLYITVSGTLNALYQFCNFEKTERVCPVDCCGRVMCMFKLQNTANKYYFCVY